MVNTTIGGVTLQGDGYSFVGDIICRKEANLTPLPLYGSDSTATDVFDFGGVIKTINISGVYIGTSIANCASFISTAEAIVQGKQEKSEGYPLNFVSDYYGTVKVKIMEFESDVVSGEPLIIRWSYKLVNSSEI